MKETRNTIQRSLIKSAVYDLHNHPTAEEVYERLVREHPHISKGTVYRNLRFLASCGELYLVETPGADRYDHTPTRHYHIRCTQCGMIEDVKMPYLEGLEQQITQAGGFQVTGHAVLFSGICPSCMAKQ